MGRNDFFAVGYSHLRLCESNELSSDHAALVHQLVKAVLAIRARLSEDDGARFDTSREPRAVNRHALSV